MLSSPGPAPAARWFGGWVALALLVQLALFAWATAPGLAGTSDSAFYLHAASTLRTTGRLLHPDGSAYRYWPPLYPVLVALARNMLGLRLLHGASLALSLLLWSWLGRWLLPAGLALALPWVLALSTPWLVVSKFVWGEAIFLALSAGYLLALFRWLRSGGVGWGGVATGIGFLLPLHRTPGFFLLGGVALGLLLEGKRLLPRLRFPLLGHFALSLLGGLVWHVYALLLAAPSVYRLNRGWAQFFSSAADYGFVIGRWLLPLRAAWHPAAPAAWGLVLVVIVAWLWPRRPVQGRAVEATPQYFLRVLWATLGFFVLLLLVSTTFTRSASGLYDAERYASVLFGPVALLVLHRLAGWPGGRWAGWLRWSVLALWLAYAAARAGSNAAFLRQAPVVEWPAITRN